MTKDEALAALIDENQRLRAELKFNTLPTAPVQEPVFCEYCGGNDDADFGLPTDHCTDCARPQPAAQRQWVGLTQQERKDIWREAIGWGDPSHDDIGLMIAIEAKLKEKNT